MILQKIKSTIKRYGLIEKGDRVLVGLSGGADSVCLTHALCALEDELGITVYTAHMNHNIRGSEADSDERFAQEFSDKLGIKCFVKSVRVKDYAAEYGISEELAGRELRYAFFDEIAVKYNINKIATAHNKNDNAETLVMNFMRGSGISGLCGIPYMRGNIIRPVLDVNRGEIEEYCRENKLSYVTDSTNLETVYTRNKVRHNLLPQICSEFNANFVDVVTKNAAMISDDNSFLAECAEKLYRENVQEGRIRLEKLHGMPISMQRRVVYLMLKSLRGDMMDISSKYIEDILRLSDTGKTGKSINLPENIIAEIVYENLFIGKKPEIKGFEYVIPVGESVVIEEMGCFVCCEYADKKENDGAEYFGGENVCEIVIRSRKNGDFFYPKGMSGRKKLKDYFIDSKIPQSERMKTGIMTINGDIAWIVGKRRDRRFDYNGKGIKIIINSLK